MKIYNSGDTLNQQRQRARRGQLEVSGTRSGCFFFRNPRHRDRPVETEFVDSSGLGALISVYKFAIRAGLQCQFVWSINSAIQQILELTRLHRLFEIVVPSA